MICGVSRRLNPKFVIVEKVQMFKTFRIVYFFLTWHSLDLCPSSMHLELIMIIVIIIIFITIVITIVIIIMNKCLGNPSFVRKKDQIGLERSAR